jgi:hypothetical protein
MPIHIIHALRTHSHNTLLVGNIRHFFALVHEEMAYFQFGGFCAKINVNELRNGLSAKQIATLKMIAQSGTL